MGYIALTDGSVMEADDRKLQEHIHMQADEKASHVFPSEVISQPTHQVRP